MEGGKHVPFLYNAQDLQLFRDRVSMFTVSLDKQVPKMQTPTSGPSIPSPTPKENINPMKFFSHESLSPCHKCFAALVFFLLCWL